MYKVNMMFSKRGGTLTDLTAYWYDIPDRAEVKHFLWLCFRLDPLYLDFTIENAE